MAAIGVSGYVMSRSQQELPQSDPLPDISVPQPQPDGGGETPVNRPVTGMPKPTATVKPQPTATPRPTATPIPQKESFFMRPVQGEVGKDFSGEDLVYNQTLNDWRVHAGIDILAQSGTQVRAAANGRVSAVEKDGMLGCTVEITHADGYVTRYANLLEQTAVAVGDEVEIGQVIGGVGTTAMAESLDPVHLHFEVYRDGVAIDPESVLPKS